ncbi:MAG: hypothetical protein FGM52_01515 [Mycobacterium sp.]|nr:hypothetical protein [Mycobacterium sp.]
MTRLRRVTATAVTLAAVASIGACRSAEPTKQPAPVTTGGQTAATASAGPAGLSGEDFLSKAESLSGSTVTLGRCSLLTTPGPDGTLPCRVLDKSGADIKDSTGLPVDIFIKQADLSPDAKSVVAGCDGFCTVQISGKLDRATDGTGYLSMADVSLKVVN